MFSSLFKKKKPAEAGNPRDGNGKFTTNGISVKEGVMATWDTVPEIFSLWQVTSAVRKFTGRMCLDTTVSAALRELRKSGKINFSSLDKQLSHYRKL